MTLFGLSKRRTMLPAFLMILVWLGCLGAVQGGVPATPLTITSVIVPSEVPFDQPVPVRLSVTHEENATPSVSVYYWIVSDSRNTSAGWRVVPAGPVQVIPEWNVTTTIFAADLPSQAFADVLSYGTKLVVWVEAVSKSFRVSTAPESDKWNPNNLEGKFLVDITDPYPPAITSVTQQPRRPTSSDQVLVSVKLTKSPLGAGIARADLEYSVNNTFAGAIVSMTETSAGIFEATIPAQSSAASVAYRISAVDEAGNRAVGNWTGYVVGQSQAEIQEAAQIDAQQAELLERYLVVAVTVVAVAIGATAYLCRARLRRYLSSRGISFKGTYDLFSISAMLSILVVCWTAYSITQYGHIWLGVAALVAELELMALLDPRIHTIFGLFNTPKSSIVLDSLRSPGTPLLASAYVLLFVGILSTLCIYIGGFLDRQGFLAITDFFASYALILVGLAALVRYLTYRQFRTLTNQT